MKKALIGIVAAGAVLALGAGARRMGNTMRTHCEQMVGQFGNREAVGKP